MRLTDLFPVQSNYRAVYTAFDPYPSFKGSAIHIEKVTGVISQNVGKTLLLTLPRQSRKPIGKDIRHLSFKTNKANFLDRGLAYSQWVDSQLDKQYQLRIGHFRDIWGGIPILKRPHMIAVFEVNGLPSIELKDRFNDIPQSTISKLYQLEQHCLQGCNYIICPSETIKKHIISRGIAADKIRVITNGASIIEDHSNQPPIKDPYIIYFGALQPWQGLPILLKSMQYLADKKELKLVICSSQKEKQSRMFQKMSVKLGLEDRIIWRYKLPREKLYRYIKHAKVSVSPLTECARNLEQGCSPLKLFESMACHTPIVASDLPVVREILTENKEAKLVRPDRPAELARAIRLLIDYPEFGQEMAKNAKKRLLNRYTWEIIDDQLRAFYQKIQTLDH